MALLNPTSHEVELAESDNCNDVTYDRPSSYDSTTALANQILSLIMKYRRFPKSNETCAISPCKKCVLPHLERIILAINQNLPVTFVLPAFPGKSPNLAKVLGVLPDKAEECSMLFIAQIEKQIREIYSPGIHIILCSDGRVFSDAVGMRDEDVTSYQHGIEKMIKELSLDFISIFNLDDMYSNMNFDQMRTALMLQYGDTLESVKDKVRLGKEENSESELKELHRLYCGITRFLHEDQMFPGQQKSRTAVQNESRIRAYEVIQKSGAWSHLIEEQFPFAVRLSIHPQGCGSKKLGLRLMAADTWMTPWHGVAVETENGYILLKRSEAESLGAQMVHSSNGKPSHFLLTNKQMISHQEK